MHFRTFVAIIIKVVFTLNFFFQGCGSKLIQSGSGASNLTQSGHGSGSTVIESGSNPDPDSDPIRIRIHNSTLEDKFFQRFKNEH
jgi:hypothetical protein